MTDKTMAEKTEFDRGVPGLNQISRKKSPALKIAVVGSGVIAIGALALGATIFLKRVETNKQAALVVHQNEPRSADTGITKNFEAEKARIKASELPPPTPIAVIDHPNKNGFTGQSTLQVTSVEKPFDLRLDGNILVGYQEKNDSVKAIKTTYSEQVDQQSADGMYSMAGTNGQGLNPGSTKSELSNQLTPTTLASVRAQQRPDLTYLMKRGTIIPCVLKTKIVTTYPGMTSCQVTKNVYSADGKLVLVERGSEITGEQRTALTQGQARIFVLWSRIDTPSGVVANINSPGSDALGASGHEAWVDDHFWKRFGGALMLSLIGDFGQALANRTQGNANGQISFSNTTGASENMANEALKNTINIPPTAYANQGSLLNVFVARDIDFRGVYDVIQ